MASTRISEPGCEKLKRSINPQSSKLQTKRLTILLCITIRYVESNKKNAIKFTQCGGLQPSATSRSTVFNNSQPTRTIKSPSIPPKSLHQNSKSQQNPMKICPGSPSPSCPAAALRTGCVVFRRSRRTRAQGQAPRPSAEQWEMTSGRRVLGALGALGALGKGKKNGRHLPSN